METKHCCKILGMATMVTCTSISAENFAYGSVLLNCLVRCNSVRKASADAAPCAAKVAHGNTGNAHFQPDHEENIQKNITYGGADEEIQRRTAVPQRGEDAVADIIKIQEQKPIDIDMQIEFGIGENIGRGADEAKHGTSAENADKRQNHADRNAGAEDGADSRFECAVFFCPEQAGNHNGTADIAANGNCP